MAEKGSTQIIELDAFQPAFPVHPHQLADVRRHFSTLFADADDFVHRGGTGIVQKARAYTGDAYALKRLAAGDADAQAQDVRFDALYEEYRCHQLVSNLRGFPRLHGFGMMDGQPVIVMQWIEGVSLRECMGALRHAGTQLPASTIAAIGSGILAVLDNAARLSPALLHRDITPGNIMLCTEAASAEEQQRRNAFDIRLIDFGCAMQAEPPDGRPVQQLRLWRRGTPAYAAPEMLADSSPEIEALRRSPAVDVFALCSVLYELYAGHTPWRVEDHSDIPPARLKSAYPAPMPTLRQPSDLPVVEAFMCGLVLDPANRSTQPELRARFAEIQCGRKEHAPSARNAI